MTVYSPACSKPALNHSVTLQVLWYFTPHLASLLASCTKFCWITFPYAHLNRLAQVHMCTCIHTLFSWRICVTFQVTIAVKDHRLPIVCCYEGCELPLAWRDFNNLSRLGHLKLPDLASSALSAYVLANRDKAHFCTTPDCPMVYRVTSEDHPEVFRCPECNVHTCTACHEQGHDGMTCGMLRSCKKTGGGVDAWVLEDRKNRRACPGCRSPVEKMGGCNKMHCTACGTIFCWVCTKKFVTQQACYDHLAKEHNGIFALEDVLRYR